VRVIDSSGWLEWFADGPLAGQYQRFLEKPREILLPAIVVYEVYKILKRERGEEMALLALGQMQQSEVVVLDATLALHAADLSLRRGLAMADAIVYATARMHDCELVTSDADLKGLDGVVFLPKV
jgi:predicted nucleic acid-binding protein